MYTYIQLFIRTHTHTPVSYTHLDVYKRQGNRYIMVIGDYFAKWVEAYAIPNQEVTTVVKQLVHNFCCRYGSPMEIHTDQGRPFESGVF